MWTAIARRTRWRKAGRTVSYEDQCTSLTQIRGELPEDWAVMNCSSQQITLKRLDKAFKAFFERCRRGQKPDFPRFKSLSLRPRQLCVGSS